MKGSPRERQLEDALLRSRSDWVDPAGPSRAQYRVLNRRARRSGVDPTSSGVGPGGAQKDFGGTFYDRMGRAVRAPRPGGHRPARGAVAAVGGVAATIPSRQFRKTGGPGGKRVSGVGSGARRSPAQVALKGRS